jgi:ubiquinone/menaquinone biosynthesis C-methylase UbiE
MEIRNMTNSEKNVQNLAKLFANNFFKKICCPESRQSLRLIDEAMVSEDGKYCYQISSKGIPLFAESFLTTNSERQQNHYDKVADKYVENLQYPHTLEYLRYLDMAFMQAIKGANLTEVAEICCGHGELLSLADFRGVNGIGVDISSNMLEYACNKHRSANNFIFIQGDATKLPLNDGQFDSVFIFGGIHHVPDRSALFSEIHRILRPGGRFYFREPVSDFFVWRIIRSIIYTISPALDAKTERPLLWKETVPPLRDMGFQLISWRTYGFLGFCFFMNSDVLVFNRLFRFIPGIKIFTRLAAKFDDLIIRIPWFRNLGLQVIGVFEKGL